MLQPCSKLVTSLLQFQIQACYNLVTSLLQPCYNLVTTLCYKVAASLWQGGDKLDFSIWVHCTDPATLHWPCYTAALHTHLAGDDLFLLFHWEGLDVMELEHGQQLWSDPRCHGGGVATSRRWFVGLPHTNQTEFWMNRIDPPTKVKLGLTSFDLE